MSETVRFRHPGAGGGFAIVSCPVVRSAQPGPGAKAAYTLLRLSARQDEHCFPGQAVLAGEAPRSRRARVGYLQELAAIELITVERRGLTRTDVCWIEPLTEALLERPAASPGPPQSRPGSRGRKRFLWLKCRFSTSKAAESARYLEAGD